MKHVPVLLEDVLAHLNPHRGDCVIDATAGYGGHARAIAKSVGSEGMVLAIDWDASALAALPEQGNITPVHGTFADLADIARAHGCTDISGTLFDFGFSSVQVEESGRGFSFREASYGEPLDMRFDAQDYSRPTARDILSSYTADNLARIFREYGEERYAGPIARHIVATRKKHPINTVYDLVERIRELTPERAQRRRIHFATRVFQALRIETNGELDNIKAGLAQAHRILKERGRERARVVALSFHSLEDRIVKHTFREWQKEGTATILTKKPIRPDKEEQERNPRSRSAKLRAAEII